MLKFKEFEYTYFDSQGFQSDTFLISKGSFVEYHKKDKDDLTDIIFDILIERFKGSAMEVVGTKNLLFHVSYIISNSEGDTHYTTCFLSTPDTYRQVFRLE